MKNLNDSKGKWEPITEPVFFQQHVRDLLRKGFSIAIDPFSGLYVARFFNIRGGMKSLEHADTLTDFINNAMDATERTKYAVTTYANGDATLTDGKTLKHLKLI